MLFKIKDLDTLLEVNDNIRCKICQVHGDRDNSKCHFCNTMKSCVKALDSYRICRNVNKIVPLTIGNYHAKSQPNVDTRKRNKPIVNGNRRIRECVN